MNNYYIEYGEFNTKCSDLDIVQYLAFPYKIVVDKEWIKDIEEVFKKYADLSTISVSIEHSATIYIFTRFDRMQSIKDNFAIPEQISDFIANADYKNDIIIKVTSDY